MREVYIDGTTDSLLPGETTQLQAVCFPSNANDKSVSWTSSSPDIASVNSSGIVTAVNYGDAVIKATKVDGIYDKDPAVHADAVRYDSLTYDESLNRRIGVMDAAAFALMRDNNVPIIVCRMSGGYIRRVLLGEAVGTIVHK